MADSTIAFAQLKELIDKSLLAERRELRDRLAKMIWKNRQLKREIAERELSADLATWDALSDEIPPIEGEPITFRVTDVGRGQPLAIDLDDFCDEGSP